MAEAISLFSGGLDSTLAILILKEQGINVTAIRFITPFEPDSNPLSDINDLNALSRRFDFNLDIYRIAEEFLEIVKHPKHGYGKNMNPCIDCRILMLKKAKEIMQETGADFIATGEVLGQRPMSQKKDMLYHIDKEADLTGNVLRPLCAGLLRKTIPEEKGIVKRDLLYSFSGRSRKPQMKLAKEFGLDKYPSPAGGCLLTDPIYSNKLRDLLAHKLSPAPKEIELLKIGRHFRLSPHCKIVVGRDKTENEIIQSLAADDDYILEIKEHGSPVVLIEGIATEEDIEKAAGICARYSDAKNMNEVKVSIIRKDEQQTMKVQPAADEFINAIRI